jgi:outer membrane protein W
MKTRMLKSIMCMFVCTVCVMPFASAQKVSLGPMIGANFATISDVSNAQINTGLAAGVFLNYSIDENFGLGVKGLFSQLGTGVENSDSKTKLNYIQIPLSGVYYFGERGNTFRPKIFLGPYVGFLLGASDQSGNEILGLSGNDSFNKVDFGGQIGLGFNYSMQNRGWINVDAGFGGSLANITDHNSFNYKNRAIFLSVGYSFPISQ